MPEHLLKIALALALVLAAAIDTASFVVSPRCGSAAMVALTRACR